MGLADTDGRDETMPVIEATICCGSTERELALAEAAAFARDETKPVIEAIICCGSSDNEPKLADGLTFKPTDALTARGLTAELEVWVQEPNAALQPSPQ
jgi:hypothetical protein